MLPRCFADLPILHVKLVVAYASMVYSPRFCVTVNCTLAKWTDVCIGFRDDVPFANAKSCPTSPAVVYLTGPDGAADRFMTRWTYILDTFLILAGFLFSGGGPRCFCSAGPVLARATHVSNVLGRVHLLCASLFLAQGRGLPCGASVFSFPFPGGDLFPHDR